MSRRWTGRSAPSASTWSIICCRRRGTDAFGSRSRSTKMTADRLDHRCISRGVVVRARGLRSLRHRLYRPSRPAAAVDRLWLRGPSAAQGFSAQRLRRGAVDDEEKRVVYEPVQLMQEFRNFDFLSPWEGPDYALPGDEKAGAAPGKPALMSRIRNPQFHHQFRPAASGGPWRAAPGAGARRRGGRARRPAYRPSAPRHRKADRIQELPAERSRISTGSIMSRR